MTNLAVLGSTRGTHLVTLANAISQKQLRANIKIVISNKVDADILNHALTHQLTAQFIDPQGLSSEQYDESITALLLEHEIDLIVLAGYMRILSKSFVMQWQNKVINVHPSLLPAFAGKMNEDVHQAVLNSGMKETGCTVHYVTDEVDAGPIIKQKKCIVLPSDTISTLKSRVQNLEGEALIEVINDL